MTEIYNNYPKLLQNQVERGKEAESLLQSDDQILPEKVLKEYISKGMLAQTYLDKINSNYINNKSKRKYYMEEYPSGPWSRYLHTLIHGKFDEEEFRKEFDKSTDATRA